MRNRSACPAGCGSWSARTPTPTSASAHQRCPRRRRRRWPAFRTRRPETPCPALRFADRKDDRKSRPFADEQQVLTSADPEDVAVPVAEPGRGLDGRQVADLFQPDEQLLCAPENDHQFVSLQYDIGGASITSTTAGAIVIWICARNRVRIWTRSGPRLSGRSGR